MIAQIEGIRMDVLDSVRWVVVGRVWLMNGRFRVSFGERMSSGETSMSKIMPAVRLEERAGFRRPSHVPMRRARVERMMLVMIISGVVELCPTFYSGFCSTSFLISLMSFSERFWSLSSRSAATRFFGFPSKNVERRFFMAELRAFFSEKAGL